MKNTIVLVMVGAALFVAGLLTNRLWVVEGQQSAPGAGFAAVPGLKGGHDVFGPYDPVQNWPRPLAESLPNHDGWTWSQATDVFPESQDRVIVAQKGELPVLPQRLQTTWLPQIGPSLKLPVGGGVPIRETASATPSSGKAAADGSDGRPGVDWRWEHVIAVFDRNGKMVEDWSQWDKIWGRPHDVEISPYDPEKHIWVVDADNHFVAKFTHDGKKQVLLLGTPGVPGDDDTHFRRPTFMAFMDANTWYLADGYDNTRVIKYDMNGKKLLQWGMKGTQPNERRPSYFNSVHGIAVNPKTRRVYINDRNNGRIQVFDENGTFLDMWPLTSPHWPENQNTLMVNHFIDTDGFIWVGDAPTSRILKFDQNGNHLYSWGAPGTQAGRLNCSHGITTDQESNLYLADCFAGRLQKFTPIPGSDPSKIAGQILRQYPMP
jgi:peptidylamidoglycolate lyase